MTADMISTGMGLIAIGGMFVLALFVIGEFIYLYLTEPKDPDLEDIKDDHLREKAEVERSWDMVFRRRRR